MSVVRGSSFEKHMTPAPLLRSLVRSTGWKGQLERGNVLVAPHLALHFFQVKRI